MVRQQPPAQEQVILRIERMDVTVTTHRVVADGKTTLLTDAIAVYQASNARTVVLLSVICAVIGGALAIGISLLVWDLCPGTLIILASFVIALAAGRGIFERRVIVVTPGGPVTVCTGESIPELKEIVSAIEAAIIPPFPVSQSSGITAPSRGSAD